MSILLPAIAGSLVLIAPSATTDAARILAPLAAAQTTNAPASGPYWATVIGDGVMLRSGPSVASAYPYGRLATGQPLKVLEAQYGWARVAAVGPSFDTVFGFVKADDSMRYDQASRTVVVGGKTPLLAPNMDANFAPDKSWRQLTMLNEGERLAVVEEVRSERDRFYSVRLPARAEGWVNLQFLEPVSQDQADRFEDALRTGSPFPRSGQAAGGAQAPTSPARETAVAPAQPPEQPARTEPATAEVVVERETVEVAVSDDGPAETDIVEMDEVIVESVPAPQVVDPLVAAAEELARKAREAKVREVTYQDLEAIWATVRGEPTQGAELEALRQQYLALVSGAATPPSIRQLATARAEQIAMRIEVQRTLLELAEQQARRNRSVQGIADLEMAMLQRRPFDAVGRLMASTVYDGNRLPLLFKVIDPTSGYTLAYVLPSDSFKPSEALGLLVGIKGRKQYDETLRIDVLAPDAIEVLDVRTTAVVPPQ